MTINKVCGSGLKSLMLGYDSIQLGNAQIAVTGGQETCLSLLTARKFEEWFIAWEISRPVIPW